MTSLSGEEFRRAMRLVPSTVTVVTVGGEEPRGITIGSFVSTSLEPPLVSFNVQRDARSHELLRAAQRYAVNVLADDQAHLSDHFANPELVGAAQWVGIDAEQGEGGVPHLSGALAVLQCVPYARYDAGDHSIFVGEVAGVRAEFGKAAVLYADRQYRSLGKVIAARG